MSAFEDIRCCNCADPVGPVYAKCKTCKNILLCPKCFCGGAELGDHQRTHSYSVLNVGGVPIFSGSWAPTDWTALNGSKGCQIRHPWSSSEEMQLLVLMEKFNLGNWDKVTEELNPSRSVKEVKEHYDRYFLRGRIGQLTNVGFSRPNIEDLSLAPPAPTNVLSPPIKSSTCKISQDDLRLLAYMPHRDDFEKEWNNDAEMCVSNLMMMHDDDDLDKSVKLAQVDRYVRQVEERRRRKAIARDYDLVPSYFKQEKPMINRPVRYTPQQAQQMKKERILKEKLRPFAQLMLQNEFDELTKGLIREHYLKQRIEELQKLKKEGVTSLEEGSAVRMLADVRVCPFPDVDATFSIRPRQAKSGEAKGNSSSIRMGEKVSTAGIAGKDFKRNSQTKIDLLSQNEKELCSASEITSSDYLMFKLCMLKEGVMKLDGLPVRSHVKPDMVNIKNTIHDFMFHSGWSHQL